MSRITLRHFEMHGDDLNPMLEAFKAEGIEVKESVLFETVRTTRNHKDGRTESDVIKRRARIDLKKGITVPRYQEIRAKYEID